MIYVLNKDRRTQNIHFPSLLYRFHWFHSTPNIFSSYWLYGENSFSSYRGSIKIRRFERFDVTKVWMCATFLCCCLLKLKKHPHCHILLSSYSSVIENWNYPRITLPPGGNIYGCIVETWHRITHSIQGNGSWNFLQEIIKGRGWGWGSGELPELLS